MEKYAIIKIKDKQIFIKEGTVFNTHTILDSSDISVLVSKTGSTANFGTPTTEGVSIKLEDLGVKRVKTQTRRYKSKSRYRRSKAHTDTYSFFKVIKIEDSAKGEIEIVKNSKKPTKNKPTTQPKTQKSTDSGKKATKIEVLDLPDNIVSILKENKLDSVEKVRKLTKPDLIKIKGLGEKKADLVISKLGSTK